MKITKKILTKKVEVKQIIEQKIPVYTMTLSHGEMIYLKNLIGNISPVNVSEVFDNYKIVNEDNKPYNNEVISLYNDTFYSVLCDIDKGK